MTIYLLLSLAVNVGFCPSPFSGFGAIPAIGNIENQPAVGTLRYNAAPTGATCDINVSFTRDQAKAEAALGEGARVFKIEYRGFLATPPILVEELTREAEPVKFKVGEREVQVQ